MHSCISALPPPVEQWNHVNPFFWCNVYCITCLHVGDKQNGEPLIWRAVCVSGLFKEEFGDSWCLFPVLSNNKSAVTSTRLGYGSLSRPIMITQPQQLIFWSYFVLLTIYKLAAVNFLILPRSCSWVEQQSWGKFKYSSKVGIYGAHLKIFILYYILFIYILHEDLSFEQFLLWVDKELVTVGNNDPLQMQMTLIET